MKINIRAIIITFIAAAIINNRIMSMDTDQGTTQNRSYVVTTKDNETIEISANQYEALVNELKVLKKMIFHAADTPHDLPLPLLDKSDFELVQTYLSLGKQNDKKEFLALINPHQMKRLLKSADKLNIKALLSLARYNAYALLTKKADFKYENIWWRNYENIWWRNKDKGNPVYAINGLKGILALGAQDGSIYLTRAPEYHNLSISTFLPDVNKVRTVRQYEPMEITKSSINPTAIGFSSDGTFFAYLELREMQIMKINQQTAEKIARIPFEQTPTHFCFNSDGSIIAVSNAKGSLDIIKNWHNTNKIAVTTVKVNKTITSLAFNSDSTLLAAGCDDGTLSLFDITKNEVNKYGSTSKESIVEMAFDSKNNMLVFCQENSKFITIFNTLKRKVIKKIYLDFIPNHLACYSKYPLLVAGGSKSDNIIFYDLDLQKIILTLNRDQKTKALSLTSFESKLLTQNTLWDVSALHSIVYFVKNCSIPELAFINSVYYASEKKQKLALTPNDLKPIYDNLYKPIQDLIADEVTSPIRKK